jgi:predicted lipid carrier protein YhbT
MEKLPTNRRPWAIPFLCRSTSSGSLRYRFDLRDMGADIVVTGDKARMEPPGEAPANLYVHGNAETFVLLMYDRLSLDAAITTGSFKVEGDLERVLVLDFDRWLAGH